MPAECTDGNKYNLTAASCLVFFYFNENRKKNQQGQGLKCRNTIRYTYIFCQSCLTGLPPAVLNLLLVSLSLVTFALPTVTLYRDLPPLYMVTQSVGSREQPQARKNIVCQFALLYTTTSPG